MANQAAAKTPRIKSKNLWTGVATIVSAAFAFFSIAPDLTSAGILADESHRAVEAINTKNYGLLIAAVVNVANILYHLFKK